MNVRRREALTKSHSLGSAVAPIPVLTLLTCIASFGMTAAAASIKYTLTIIVEPSYGGWLLPGAGTNVYNANTVVPVYWWHSPDYNLECYDINGTVLGWKE